MKKLSALLTCSALTLGLMLSQSALAEELKVNITKEMASIEVMHNGEKITIMRNQDSKNTVAENFAKTSRPCPPFCIQPATLAPGVETIGEVEVLNYLKQMHSGDDSVLVVDSRTPDWVKRGTIPGSVNIPWTKLSIARGSDPFTIGDIMMKQFGVKESEGLFNFNDAKTLVLFCNGMWCGQSPANIKTLLQFGYPAHKIKWYRGGMQDWEILGLSTVKGK